MLGLVLSSSELIAGERRLDESEVGSKILGGNVPVAWSSSVAEEIEVGKSTDWMEYDSCTQSIAQEEGLHEVEVGLPGYRSCLAVSSSSEMVVCRRKGAGSSVLLRRTCFQSTVQIAESSI
jgi:hypothetical protein